jgi:5-methyltetrahydrofolate--homocysteine methyltransferase
VNFLSLLHQHKLLVGDGAMGSRLIARGLPVDVPGELWNVEKPDAVEAVHREYVRAGAQYVLTNTFGGNAVALGKRGLAARLEEINTAAAELALRAAGEKAVVFGDMGPAGELLEPLGELSRQEAHDAFAAQAGALAAAGAHAIIAETFDSAEELRIALAAAREVCELPLVASMKFNPEPAGTYHSMMGDSPEQLVAVAEELSCAVVGTNCGHGIRTMLALVAQIAALTDLPVICQPNAGLPELAGGKTVYREDASMFAEHLPALYEAGAAIIGGCCGTTAEHIRAIRALADRLDSGGNA